MKKLFRILLPLTAALLALAPGAFADEREGPDEPHKLGIEPVILLVDRTDDLGFIAACNTDVPNDCTLRGAISHANQLVALVEIELEAATYQLSLAGSGENLNNQGDLDIEHHITLRGKGAESTIITGDYAGGFDDRLVHVQGGNLHVRFENLALNHAKPPSGDHAVLAGVGATVAFEDCAFVNNGTSLSGGGALSLASGVEATISGSRFAENRGHDGPVIYSLAESLEISDSLFEGNLASGSGGALYQQTPGMGQSTVIVDHSVFDRNSSEQGGALHLGPRTDVQVFSSTFRNNNASNNGPPFGEGGAISTNGGLYVERSTFHGNGPATKGSAIFTEFASDSLPEIDIYNSTFSGHRGSPDVAAVHLRDSKAELLHTTFSHNDRDLQIVQTEVTMTNNLLTAGCSGVLAIIESKGGNMAPDDSCWGEEGSLSDAIIADFELAPLGDYGGDTATHLPGPTSAAVGFVAACPDTDQRGMPRPGTSCSSGAVERLDSESHLFGSDFELGGTMAWTLEN